ncbi:MAG: pyocin knob domain-containing protein [Caulobacter sp.]
MSALERLTSGYYNSQPYHADNNPGGLGNGGHVINFPLCLADFAAVANDLNEAVIDAPAVLAAEISVTNMLAQVTAQAGPVIAGLATYGMPGRAQITNLNNLNKSGWFYSTTTATGRPGGETDGFVFAVSDGATQQDGAQLFLASASGKIYKRHRVAGTWQAWTELTTAGAFTDTAFGAENTLASAATTQLGSAGSRLVEITGATTITSFGSTGALTTNPSYLVRFAGALTLTHHAANLILPGGKNIVTAAGDVALMQYLGSGQWRCAMFMRANGEALTINPYGAEVSVASAATVDLGAQASSLINITGTTTITSLGASAAAARPLYRLRFAGALTLTHNAVSLILPGGANIVTATGDSAVALYLGGGNWRVLSFHRADGKAPASALASATEAKAGTVADKAVTPAGLAAALQSGVQLYADDSSAGADTVVITLTPAPAALEPGMAVLVKVQGTNTGPATLNVNGLGAVTIKLKGANLPAGALKDGVISKFVYDGTFWQLLAGGGVVASSLGFTGYRIYEDGWIEQWGQVLVNSVGSGTSQEQPVAFPLTFPIGCATVALQVVQNAGAIGGGVKEYFRNLSGAGMNVGLDEISGSLNATVYWQVGGY